MQLGWDGYKPEGVILNRKAENTPFFQVIESIHAFLDLLFAVGHEALVEAPGLEGLRQGEDVFLAPVTVQGLGNLGLALLASIVAVAGEHSGVTLARHDGVQYCQGDHSGDVGDDVVQLHVHLVERPSDTLKNNQENGRSRP